jgi:SAM-dependent methyltransferase
MSTLFNLSEIVDLNGLFKVDKHFYVDEASVGIYSDMNDAKELQMIDSLKSNNWREVVSSEFAISAPWLYQIIVDLGRNAFLDFLSIKENGTYLDVGSGWGQVCIPLAKFGNSVALDLTSNRLNILREIARQEQVRLSYLQGNFLTFPFTVSTFDLIVFNGSLEWIGIGRESNETIREVQLKALKRANQLLKEDGKIYIGIENSLGLKYILGSPDDHTGIRDLTFLPEKLADELYSTQHAEQRLTAKTWSLKEYQELIQEAGLKVENIYGCFPDYKIIRHMVKLEEVNSVLGNHGLLYPEHIGTDGSMLGYDDKLDSLYRLLAKNGLAHLFCPSYGMILTK